MKLLFLIFCLLFLLSACGSAAYRYASAEEKETITTSLFNDKERSISEEDIQRILNGKIKSPDTLRVAVYKYYGRITRRFSGSYGTWADEDRLKTDQSLLDTLITEIRKSNRVQKVILLPMIVTGMHPNINQLREASVRLQADMIFVFGLDSDLYYQYRAFKKDDAKAFATCEAVLMDIRTGVIPHSSVVTREFYGKKDAGDLSLDDMRRRVQNRSLMMTMAETGQQVAAFLGKNDKK